MTEKFQSHARFFMNFSLEANTKYFCNFLEQTDIHSLATKTFESELQASFLHPPCRVC